MKDNIKFDKFIELNPQSKYNEWVIRLMCLGKDIVVKNICIGREILEMKND